MSRLSVMLFALALPAAPVAANPELARSNLCLGCHAVDRKLVGPAFRDVAARYAGQKDAALRLAEKIVRGGSGAWGVVPMPANPKVSTEDALRLANWVLSMK
jgi:cytochrome c